MIESLVQNRFARAGGLALLLLLLALSTVFVSGNDRSFLYRPGLHNAVTANHLAVAANLSPEHGFLGFYRRHLFGDQETYEAYNRFPLGGYLLIKAALLPFPDDLLAQIRAARTLMLTLLAAAAVTAFLSLRRLTSSSSVALTAILLSFSSFHPLFYGDMVAAEGSIDLFAVLLVFHGMVVFAQEGRFRQLLAKTCGALLVGWHVYGLLLPFIVFGLASEWRRGGGSGRSRAARLLHSRHLALGVVALTFGLSMLTFNFAREHAALNSQDRETALADLPSFQSMMYRLGQNRGFNLTHAEALAWRTFLETLFRRAGQASVPYYLSRENLWADAWAAWGLIAFVACAAGLTAVRHRVLLATLATFGLCWGLLVRHTVAFHGHEGLFLVGLPLVCFTLVMLPVRRLSERLAGGCAVAALPVFVLSSWQMHRPDSVAEVSDSREVISDCAAVRRIAAEGLVVMVRDPDEFQALEYCLAGRILVRRHQGWHRRRADFLLTRERTSDGLGLLTPDNRQVFLYNRAAYDVRYAALGDPVLEGGRGWKVHRVGNRLIYTTGEACSAREGFRNEPQFFLEFLTAGEAAGSGRQQGFRFRGRRFDVAGRCIAEILLPAPDVARIRTGQIGPGGGPLWSEERALPPADGLRTH